MNTISGAVAPGLCICVYVCVCVECEHMCPCITGSMWSFLEMILSNLMNIWARRYFSFSSVTLFFLCWGVLPSSLTSTHNKALMIHTFLFCALSRSLAKRRVTRTYCQHTKLLCANGSYAVLRAHMRRPSIRNAVIEKLWKWIEWMETWSNFFVTFLYV